MTSDTHAEHRHSRPNRRWKVLRAQSACKRSYPSLLVLGLVLAGVGLLGVLGAAQPATASGDASVRAGVPSVTPPPKVTYPARTPQAPPGIPAIRPTRPGQIPAFTSADAQRYVAAHPMPHNAALEPHMMVMWVAILPSRQVSALLHADFGRPGGALLCVVQAQGTFTFLGPPPRDKGAIATITYRYGFEVFDATTGNLLMHGGLKQPLGTPTPNPIG
jgi:hypothetical protein